jgi:hypothetical protein
MLDFGLHRWLEGEREEAYSDWLAWILGHLSASAVFFILKLPDDGVLERCAPHCPVLAREAPVPGGRTDLLVRFGDVALTLIELKKGMPTDLEQLERFLLWFKDQPEELLRPVIICHGEDVERGDFLVRSWHGVSQRLRSEAKAQKDAQPIVATMILGFAGAVEQNLAGLSSGVANAAAKLGNTFIPSEACNQVSTHLEGWLDLDTRRRLG